MNAYKRTRKDKHGATTIDDTYTIQFIFQGQRIRLRTPCTSKETALTHARQLHKQLAAGNWAILNQLKHRKPADHTPTTLATLIPAYTRLAPIIREIQPTTIKLNKYALYNILRATKTITIPEDEPHPEHDHHYAAVKLTQLTPALIHQYKTNILNTAQNLDPEDAQRQYRTANSILLQARSIFTQELLETYARENIHIPDNIKPFTQATGFKKVQKLEYHPAPDPLLNKTFAALPQLEQTNPNAYIAIWLTIGFGLRKSEIAKTTPANFTDIDNTPHWTTRKTTNTKTITTKNDDLEVSIACQLDAWAKLKPHIDRARAANQPYLLAGNKTQRTEDTFREISAWMRELGWDTQKTIHEFRAWAGCKIAEAHGLIAARNFLRHAHYNTTDRYYGRYINKKVPHVPLTLPSLQPPTVLPSAAQA